LVSSTGIAGFTLGGGIGWLVRKYGLAADNLISVDIVTADGKVRRASMEENPDLFWGVRGGGGNFGVITSFEYRLHPVGPIVLGGMMLFPEDKSRDVLRTFSAISGNFPEELTTLAALITAPPLPFIPAEFHGKRVLAILACYLGDVGDGEKSLRPLRESKPIADVVGPMPYLALQSMLDESAPPGLLNYWKAAYLSSLSNQAIDAVLSQFHDIPSHLSAIHMHHLGGAVRRVGEDATAFGERNAAFVINFVSTWSDPKENEAQVAWTRKAFDALSAFSTGGAYINFLGQEGGERVKAAYGAAKYARLVELKRKYDPANLFSLNQNVKP
jgi:FAD/FMN-containing dehydrogenase